MSHARSCLINSLRIVNPYVAETMRVSGMTTAPKENVAALSVLAASDASATGISAFAFQGSNAHVILGTVDSEAAHVVS